MENPTSFEITLEHVNMNDNAHTFRVSFFSTDSRILLPYPQVTGIRILNTNEQIVSKWTTRLFVTAPLDDFVLSPGDRFSFDLRASVKCDSNASSSWTIEMPTGLIRARFEYHVDDKRDWYDFLAKRSRFASITKPWNGTVVSNTIEFENQVS